MIKRKLASGIVKFMQQIFNEFKFEKIITDCGREFENASLKAWFQEKNILHHLRPAYYHKGSGRVERVIRTIREALNKEKGLLCIKLPIVTQVYNSVYHRGIGMSPNEALINSNWNLVILNSNKYKKEFKYKELKCCKMGDKVMIKEEILSSKEDKKFKKKGIIVGCLPRDTYEVLTEDSKIVVKHFSQLKILPGML